MIRYSSVVAMVSCAGSLMFLSRAAQAISLPDSSSCSSTLTCLVISNTNTSNSSYGITGTTLNGVGVYGVSNGIGIAVAGNGGSGVGVNGLSTHSDGVRGTSASASAAGVSAINTAGGLAYWGTGNITITGSTAQKAGGGAWTAPSDARIKKDVQTLRLGLDELREVRPVTFKYNGLGGTDNDGREYVGVIAQELEKLFPSMVTTQKKKLRDTDTKETDVKLVDPSAFTYVLINAVKEQQDLIDRQERRIAALEHGRSASLSASMLGSGVGAGLMLGLLPLGFVALRRRRASRSAE
jgi:hypothetical protein